MVDNILRVRDLVKNFSGLRAVNGVSLDVQKQTMTILIGPNGSGKTTLINLITGVYKPDRGRIMYDGRDITGLPLTRSSGWESPGRSRSPSHSESSPSSRIYSSAAIIPVRAS